MRTTRDRRRRSPRTIGFPVAVKALAPELPHKAKLGGVRLGLRTPAEVEVAAAEVLQAATRAGAASPEGAGAADGERRRGPGGRGGRRAVRRRDHGATRRCLAEAGDAVFVAVSAHAEAGAGYVTEQADRCGLDRARHDLPAVAKAVEVDRAGGARPARPADLARGEPAAGGRTRGGRRRRPRGSPPGVIYGLLAALGWGSGRLQRRGRGPADRQRPHGDRRPGAVGAVHDGAAAGQRRSRWRRSRRSSGGSSSTACSPRSRT